MKIYLINCELRGYLLLVIFDTEGVLIDGEFLPELAKIVGKEEEVWEITKKGINGEIEWEKGLIDRINELKGVSYEDCMKVANNMQIMNGAKETFNELRQLGFKTITVSGGPDILIDRIKEELQKTLQDLKERREELEQVKTELGIVRDTGGAAPPSSDPTE